MKSVYSTSVKVQHQPPLEFSLFFLPVLRCLSLVLLTLAQRGAGCLSPKSGAGPRVGWGISRLLLHHHLSDHVMPVSAPFCRTKNSPSLPAPPNPLFWTWFKPAQSVSMHCFRGQLENLRNEWKQTVTDQLNCNLSSQQERTPVGVPSQNKSGWTLLGTQRGGKKESRDKERFTHQEICGLLLRGEVTSWPLICNAGISAWHQASFSPLPNATPVTVCVLHLDCAIDFHRILPGTGTGGPVMLLQPKRSTRDRLCPLVSPNSHKQRWRLLQHSFPEQNFVRSGRSKILRERVFKKAKPCTLWGEKCTSWRTWSAKKE